MAAIARLLQFELGAAGDDFAAMAQEGFQNLLQVQQTRLAVENGHHVHAEGVLHLRLFVQIVQHHFRHFAALQLDHHAHAGLVRLVANLADAFDAFLAHQLADLDAQVRLVHLIRQFVDDDRLTADRFLDVLEMHLGAHHHAATTGAIAFLDAGRAVDDAGGGEIGRGHDFDQVFDADHRIAQHRQTGIDDFVQVVRRDVGRHADRDAGRTVDQQIRELGRQDQRLVLGTVVVGTEVDGFLVDVGKQLVRDLGHADFGVTHRRRVVAVDRTEVALTIDQRIAQRKVLRHANDGVVHRGIAVRVVFTDDVADHARRFLVGLVPVVVQLVHREQHAAMHRLQTIPHIRQRPPDDHAHRVIEVGTAHFLFQADGQGFFGELVFHCGRVSWFCNTPNPRIRQGAHD
jgi:KaiC/GvpD/RAD55 family RecA-like ATPase